MWMRSTLLETGEAVEMLWKVLRYFHIIEMMLYHRIKY